MGESRIPLYAYIDETGNTGHNLFDEAQPDFYTAALITKGDFDIAFGTQTRALAQRLGAQTLHGKELGLKQLEIVAPDVIKLMEAARAHFYVSRVEKRYLLAVKVFDLLFDSGENAGVAWHHYNVRPLKLMLAFKLASTIDEDTARQFWQCVLEPKKEATIETLPRVCEALQRNLDQLPDVKAREILGEGLEWAKSHPESIQIHTDRRIARQGHFPNMVAFANLLDGLEEHSKRYKRPVARITHDQQSEFQKTLGLWHDMFSNASPEEVRWAGESYRLQKVVGSQFEVKADSASPGIQITDIVLWLYHQLRKKRPLPGGCLSILDYVFANGWENDFSFEGVERSYIQQHGPTLVMPLTAEQEESAQQMLKQAEARRLSSMAQYEMDGLPPFMRSG